jgi:acetyl esterase/lipase
MFWLGDNKRDKGLSTPEDVIRIDNISYGPFSNWNLLDIYRPKDVKGTLPVIVNVHGGGWVYGNKETYQYYCMNLSQNGFVVVNFSYRLAPEHKYPAGIEDLNNVMKWIFDDSNNEGFDLNNIFLFGDSAGANMAALYSCICTNPTYAKEYDFDVPNNFVPKGLALGCGMYELEKLKTGSKLMKGVLKDLLGRNEVHGELKLIEPLRYMTKDFPPAFIMTSTGDFLKS